MSKNTDKDFKYYVLTGESPEMMLLYDIPKPGPVESWALGRRFHSVVDEPVVVTIRQYYEKAKLLPYFNVGIMSDPFLESLRNAGVDNLDIYDAILQSEDGSIIHRGYKAFNLIGLVSAVDLKNTKFQSGHEGRLLDAAMTGINFDTSRAHGLLMFRLAENISVVCVHEKVKKVIEDQGFEDVVFRDPSAFVTL